MGQEFVDIFTDMGMVSAVTLGIGLVLLLIEIFSPKFGIFAIPGTLCLIVGVVFRIVDGATLFQSAMLSGIVLAFIILTVVAILRSVTQKGTAVPVNYAKVSDELLSLKGQKGVVTIDCRPIGRALINKKEYEVMAGQSRFIVAGSDVEVIDVTIEAITVEKVKLN